MKKIVKIIISVLCVFSIFIFSSTTKLIGSASGNFSPYLSYVDYSSKVQTILNDFCAFKTRVAGSENEKNASIFIKNYIDTNISGVEAVNNISTQNGVQNFKFISKYTDTYLSSQNIIYRFNAAENTKKKIIICCNYDAPYKYDSETGEYVSFDNDALNVSAAGVAALMLLMETLPQYNFNFNIEFVFFGSGEMDFAGSEFYTNGMSEDDVENILCVINLDKIALGSQTYFYIDEVKSQFSNYVSGVLKTYAKEIDLVHLNKTSLVENELGLPYSHIALGSDNVKFMKRGIATINFFSGCYEDGIVMGLNEYDGKEVVSYTKNDTISYISENYGDNVVSENLFKVNSSIERLLVDKDFVENTSKATNQTSWFYKIFANDNLVFYVTAVSFVVMIIVAMFIYYKLTVKSYYANVEMEFLASVVKISENVDKNGENKDVAKVVSQVIASDIKKDKTLKAEKKKKK